ncbi:MAG TPA: cytidine deaminase [Mycobacteriales bacterium]|nr:cytidine deaminase [Mycobacteriales bacterium]
MPEPAPLDPEDAKLVALARAARTRTGALAGAAVRDDTGRTYVAVSVDLPSLRLTAVQLAVAMSRSSGAGRLEAAVLVSPVPAPDPADLAVLHDVTAGFPLHVTDPDGLPHRSQPE